MILALLTNVVIALAILAVAWIGGNWVKNTIYKMEKLDQTIRSFLGGMAKYTIVAIAIITVLNQFGVQTASLIAVLGAAGLAIGLALQGTLSNVAAGVMMLILRPFNVGDFIEFNGVSGTVKTLNLFGTELSTLSNVYVYAPNSKIWTAEIYNFSRNKQRRQDIMIGISYDSDINKAIKAVQKVLDKDERILTTKGKEAYIAVGNLGESSVDILVRIWTAADHPVVKNDVTQAIKETLDKEGIDIPFPTVHIANANDTPAPAAKVAAAKKKKAA